MISISKADPQDFSSTDVLFQTEFWGSFRQKVTGQKSLYFWVTYKPDNEDSDSKSIIFPFLVQIRKTKNGNSYAYAQRAPAVSVPDEFKSSILEELAFS